MDWKVRFVDFPQQYRKMESELMGTIKTVLSQGDLILRQQLRDFENNLAAFVGTKYAVGVSNCTDGLYLTLEACGIGAGDEVITVSHSFVATVAAIHHTGATPILVDVGNDHNLNVNELEKAITPKTKAILPVHLNGRMCNMEEIMNLAERHNLLVIEDAAQVLGGSYKGQKAGSIGLAGCFSFYPAKTLGATGDAGAVVTNSQELYEKLVLLRDHGRLNKTDLAGWGYNCRLDNLQAAILDLKLKYLPEWIRRRRELAGFYHKYLAHLPQITLPPAPTNEEPYYDVYQNFVIEAENRDQLFEHLTQNGIETLISWPKAVHHQKSLGLTHFKLPRTDELCRKVISLPLTTELTDEQIEFVANTIAKFYTMPAYQTTAKISEATLRG